MSERTAPISSELDLFLSLWDRQPMSPVIARSLLKIDFPPEIRNRIGKLLLKNKEDEIEPWEQNEIETFNRVASVLTVMKLKARDALKKPKVARKRSA